MDYSIVTTVYNDEKLIIRYLDELCNQTCKPKEIIIADGGSSDNTVNLARQYSSTSDISIRICGGTRLNIAQGFNVAIKETQSTLIGITAVGNRYPNNFFAELVKKFEEQSDLEAVYPIIKGDNSILFAQIYTRTFIGNYLDLGMPTNHGVLIKKITIEKLDYFYESFYYAGEDDEFFQRFLKYNHKCMCVKSTNVTWEVPNTFKAYCRQTRLYGIGRMQTYENRALILINIKSSLYILLWLLDITFFIVLGSNVLSIIFTCFIFFYNTFLAVRKGIDVVFMRNIHYYLTIFNLVRDCKYFLNKNKIQVDRRLQQRYVQQEVVK